MQELVDMGYITQGQLNKAKAYQMKNRCKIGEALLDLGFVTARTIENYVDRVLGKR